MLNFVWDIGPSRSKIVIYLSCICVARWFLLALSFTAACKCKKKPVVTEKPRIVKTSIITHNRHITRLGKTCACELAFDFIYISYTIILTHWIIVLYIFFFLLLFFNMNSDRNENMGEERVVIICECQEDVVMLTLLLLLLLSPVLPPPRRMTAASAPLLPPTPTRWWWWTAVVSDFCLAEDDDDTHFVRFHFIRRFWNHTLTCNERKKR